MPSVLNIYVCMFFFILLISITCTIFLINSKFNNDARLTNNQLLKKTIKFLKILDRNLTRFDK